VLPVPPAQYDDQVRDVRLFLEGKSDELLDRLSARMKDAALRTEFELAAEIRDQIRALEVTLQEQRVVSADFVDQDVVGYHRDGIALEIVVMSIRAGKLSGNRAFSFSGQEFPDAELISSFIGLYYDMGASVPDELLLPIEIEDAALKAEWLAERRAAQAVAGTRRTKVEVLVPQRGDRRKLIDLARKNAAASFASRRNARADTELALGKLQKRLKLARLPRTIECYDVSHIQGFATVASMVVFVDGRPDKARYRTYKVRAPAAATGDRKNDDFASMYEVLSRRFRRAKQAEGGDDDAAWKLPDLIVIDGGKGQVSAATEVMRELGLEHIPLIGLAKRLEEIVIPNQRDTVLLPKSSSSLRLLQHLRDEAHRFAITFHRTLRARRTLQTELTNIPGIGPKTVVKIFDRFGSVRGVQSASLADLHEVLGPKTGQNVYDYFQAQREALPAEADIPVPDEAGETVEDIDDVQLLDDEDDDPHAAAGDDAVDEEEGDDIDDGAAVDDADDPLRIL
jgi:excinuclease ABC subunit C